jgi:glyoxylase-like metal-dependent hydrolase (beta-lactamase superfamily II)
MADALRHVHETNVPHGVVQTLSPLVRRVTAPNPGAFTYHGTGTFIVGHGSVAVIDPGPELDEHLAALLGTLAGERIEHILITHSHIDHRPLASALAAATGAQVHAWKPGAGEAGLAEGGAVKGDGWTLEAIETPGHAHDHLCFALLEEDTVFTGDHVMGWSTTVIPGAPEGDLADYMRSLDHLRARPERRYRPTHGPDIPDGPGYVAALTAHRLKREAMVLEQLAKGPSAIPDLVPPIYGALDSRLIGAAGATLHAHLIKLAHEGQVIETGGVWSLVG